jgi:hypothetical protein
MRLAWAVNEIAAFRRVDPVLPLFELVISGPPVFSSARHHLHLALPSRMHPRQPGRSVRPASRPICSIALMPQLQEKCRTHALFGLTERTSLFRWLAEMPQHP